jgi:hypothetical protein
VSYLFKTRTVKLAETVIARELPYKHSNCYATAIQALGEEFSMWSVLRLHKQLIGQWIVKYGREFCGTST